MKYVKSLGLLAAAAVALVLLVGSGQASATVLCKTNAGSGMCPAGESYGFGSAIHFNLFGQSRIKAGFAVIACEASEIEAFVTNPGSTTESVEAQIGILGTETFLLCSAGQTVTVKSKGNLIFRWVTGDEGLVTLTSGNSISVKVGSTECTYGGTTTSPSTKGITLRGGSAFAELEASEAKTELVKTAGGALCASPAKWIAIYDSTQPSPFHIAAG